MSQNPEHPQKRGTSHPPPAGQPKSTYSQCHVEGPYIAMTFDDGPHGANTPRLLEMLRQRKIHATFFLVGQCVALPARDGARPPWSAIWSSWRPTCRAPRCCG